MKGRLLNPEEVAERLVYKSKNDQYSSHLHWLVNCSSPGKTLRSMHNPLHAKKYVLYLKQIKDTHVWIITLF